MRTRAARNTSFLCDIWDKRPVSLRAQGLSIAIHSLAALLFVLPLYKTAVGTFNPPKAEDGPFKIIFPRGGGGSGGERNPIPATVGKAPPFAPIQFTPPEIPRNFTPRLPAQATLLGQPDTRVPDVPFTNFGDPNASGLTASAGPGGGGGYGTRCCGGDGPGDGRGVGPGKDSGFGGGEPGPVVKGTLMPECVYCPNPTFSDEARKSKTQGTVMLRLAVTPEGRATRISVARGLGMGLDEKAIEAVRGWRFRPAREPSGRPVPVWVEVEVTFRLL